MYLNTVALKKNISETEEAGLVSAREELLMALFGPFKVPGSFYPQEIRNSASCGIYFQE